MCSCSSFGMLRYVFGWGGAVSWSTPCSVRWGPCPPALPKGLPLFCQPCDADRLGQLGFLDVRPVHEAVDFAGIEIVRTDGKHGVGLIGMKMGPVSGFVLIWCGCVREVLESFRPDVNHCLLTRQALRAELEKQGLCRVRIPADGESITF